jgi:uncharacterized membrane protein YfcA
MTDASVPDRNRPALPYPVISLTSVSRGTTQAKRLGLAAAATLAIGAIWMLVSPAAVLHSNMLALVAVYVAATISSIAGFAFSAVAGAMLLHLVDNTIEVVMVMMVCSIAIQSLSVALLWRDIDWRGVSVFLLGGLAGLPLGVWLLLHLDARWFKDAIGALLVAYAVYGVFKRQFHYRTGNILVDILVGFSGGISGGLAGFPGAAVTIWCGMRGWDKRRQRAVYQPFILVMQILGLLAIRILQPVSSSTSVTASILPFVPAALLGAWTGVRIFESLSDRHFTIAVNALLFVSGVGLMI